MAQPPVPGSSGIAPPSPPTAPPVVPPGAPYGYPPPLPPRRTNEFPVLLIALLAFVVISIVFAAALYVVISGGFVPPGTNRPAIGFSTVNVSSLEAAFTVTTASLEVGPTNYRVNFEVNAARGSLTPLSSSFTMTVGFLQYSIRWFDTDANNLVSVGDRFSVSRSSGFPYNSTFTFYLVWSDGTYIQSASWQTFAAPNKPVITFGGVTLSGTTAVFIVADTSQAVSYSNYKFNLKVNGTFGTARNLGSSGTGVGITVNGVTYTVTYTDVGGEATVNGGDQFTVAGLRASTQYVFFLLWSDGSQIQSRTWATP